MSTRRFSRYGCEKISARSRSGSFHAAPLPSNRPESSDVVNCGALTIVVLAVSLMRPSASSTRSSANRGCPGAFVNGGHAVEISRRGAGCAAAVSHSAGHNRTRMTARPAAAADWSVEGTHRTDLLFVSWSDAITYSVGT